MRAAIAATVCWCAWISVGLLAWVYVLALLAVAPVMALWWLFGGMR
jgi:hypothetical protein